MLPRAAICSAINQTLISLTVSSLVYSKVLQKQKEEVQK